MKKVSVIVPTYNQSRYLPACLDSIWFQDYEEIEIIVVNDGSTDDTKNVFNVYREEVANNKTSFARFYDEEADELLRSYHDRYPKEGRRLKLVEHDTNLGLARALNSGFRACNGEYCTYVPSDNICYPSMILDMVNTIENQNVDFVYADMLIFSDDGRVLRRFSLPDYSFHRCFEDWYFCGVAKLYKRELHDQWGYYDETLLAHDHELFLRFALNGAQFLHIPRILMGVRDHEKDREVHIHEPGNWNRLIEESKRLVKVARRKKPAGSV